MVDFANGVKVREDVFELYWYFANERMQIFLKRLEGQSRPWTDDPILTQYKFCNTYRVLDYVSQDLIKRVINTAEGSADDIFRIILIDSSVSLKLIR